MEREREIGRKTETDRRRGLGGSGRSKCKRVKISRWCYMSRLDVVSVSSRCWVYMGGPPQLWNSTSLCLNI